MSDVMANLLHSFPQILPEIVLVAFSCIVFLGGTFFGGRHVWSAVTLLGLAVAAAFIPLAAGGGDFQVNVYVSPLLSDSLAWYMRFVALGAGVVFVLFSWNEIGDRQASDYYGCLLIILPGFSLIGAVNDLVTLFLALEMISIPTYIMLYLPRIDTSAQEAALKYFMLSIFSSAILLFGFSYLYGLAGSTNLAVLLQTMNDLGSGTPRPVLALVAVIMVTAGLGFKMTAVPFHFYAPDVYQGTATVMAAVLAFVPKAAGFVALLRVFGFVLPEQMVNMRIGEALSSEIPMLLWFLAFVTMFLGNILALLQDNLRRLFAYSSVAHAGYMLIGLAAAPYLREAQSVTAGPDGVAALLYYLVAYGVMTVGAFAVLAFLHSPERPVESVNDLAGLAKTHPWPAVLMTVFLFSLIGIPFTAGFTGKLLIFFGAIGVPGDQARLFRLLAVFGVINAAIGAWYYLRLIAVMYLRTAVKPVTRPATVPGLAAIILCAILTIGLSIPPGATWMLRAVHHAGGGIRQTATVQVSERE